MKSVVHAVPCLKNNYAYVIEAGNQTAFVVDPSEAPPIIRFLKEKNFNLTAILNTHHHSDHIGGNAELKREYGCPVYGYKGDQNRIAMDHLLVDGQTFTINQQNLRVLHIPGHTLGHIAYIFGNEDAVFCGDTLFCLGCGRLFEGSYPQMIDSLKKLACLKDDCAVYCGHEYTLDNLRFCQSVVKNDLSEVELQLRQKLQSTGSTLPSTMGFEKQFNPFLQTLSRPNEFQRLRELKNKF